MPGSNENFTSYDADGNLIAREAATQEKLYKPLSIKIDGHVVTVMEAVPATDVLGNEIKEPDGRPKPRTTTIYDAARKLVADGLWSDEDLHQRIPVLCHQDHLNPVGVCRMCSVHVSRFKKRSGKVEPDDRLVPACHHEVQKDMIVTTSQGDDRNPDSIPFAKKVKRSLQMLSELLVVEHVHPDPAPKLDTDGHPLTLNRETLYTNELIVVTNRLYDRETEANQLVAPTPRPALTSHPGRNTPAHPQSKPLNLAEIKAENQAFPYSSETITVDHDRCILCDRCVRSCSEVKPFKVIGHTGKGLQTRISFDLDVVQNDSSCVQCGECMTACPTGALTLKRRVAPIFENAPRIPFEPQKPLPAGYLSAEDMMKIELDYTTNDGERRKFKPFGTLPFSYLKWNEGAVRRRIIEPRLKNGQPNPEAEIITCGEYETTAYFLVSGKFKLQRYKAPTDEKPSLIQRLTGSPKKRPRVEDGDLELTPAALVVGELAALSNQRRTASIFVTERAEVLEVTRNLFDMAQRSPSARNVLASVYTRNAISVALFSGPLFRSLSNEQRFRIQADLRRKLTRVDALGQKEEVSTRLLRLQAGETIVREGELANAFYLIRSGFVKVVRQRGGSEEVIARLPMKVTRGADANGKDIEEDVNYFGEVALMADHPEVRPLLTKSQREKRRIASVVALDPVEVIRIPFELFDEMRRNYPGVDDLLAAHCQQTLLADAELRERLIQSHDPEFYQLRNIDAIITRHLEETLNVTSVARAANRDRLNEFVNQGLYQGQKLLVLDLQSCTRCDECTRACADSHGGVDHLSHGSGSVSRLLREGLRFGDFLVAASCRSCHKPYCMEGCPVDAIHRKGDRLEVQIDDHCIGCGLCEKNCPYGSIQMVPDYVSADGVRHKAAFGRQAVNCDLCHDLVPEGADTFCVSACPHEAAFRWSGDALLKAVSAG